MAMRGSRAAVVRLLPSVLLLIGAAWFTAAPSLDGPLLFDDLDGVIGVAADYVPSDLLDLRRFWLEEPTCYRPVRYASFVLDWHRGGGNTRAFHATNLVLHAGCGLLLWSLLRRLRPGAAWPLLAALLFLVHPLQTAAVSYISGRKDMLAAFFYLAALHANLSAARSVGRAARMLFGGAFLLSAALSFLSKEMALTLPLATLLCDRIDGARGGRAPVGWPALLRRRAWFYGALAAGGVAGLLDKLLLRPGTQIPLDRALDLVANLPLALRTLAWHVRKAWLPWPQAADLRGLFPERVVAGDGSPGPAGWSEIWNGGGAAVTIAGLLLLAGWAWAIRRDRPRRGVAAAGLAFFLLALLPVLNLVRLNEPAAEHYLYLPLAGWAAAVAGWLAPASWRFPWRWRQAAAIALPLALAAASVARSVVWTSSEMLWTSVVETNRSGSRGWNNLGLLQLADGDSLAGEASLRRALSLAPGEPRTTANLMVLDHARGRLAAAESLGAAALAMAPGNKLLISLQGRVLLASGRATDARDLLERLTGADDTGDLPDGAWRADLGAARLLCGDAAGAAAMLAVAAAEQPAVAGTWTNLGAAHIALRNDREAEAALRRALALPGASGRAHRNLAVARPVRLALQRPPRGELPAAADRPRLPPRAPRVAAPAQARLPFRRRAGPERRAGRDGRTSGRCARAPVPSRRGRLFLHLGGGHAAEPARPRPARGLRPQ